MAYTPAFDTSTAETTFDQYHRHYLYETLLIILVVCLLILEEAGDRPQRMIGRCRNSDLFTQCYQLVSQAQWVHGREVTDDNLARVALCRLSL